MSAIRDLAERAFSLYNSGDIDAFMEMYDRDAVLRTPDGEFEGADAIRAFWFEQFSSFPDSHITSTSTVEEGDTLVAEFDYTGTNTGPMALPDGTSLVTGKAIGMAGMQLLQFRDGRIVRHAIYHDDVEAMAQLGLMPGRLTV